MSELLQVRADGSRRQEQKTNVSLTVNFFSLHFTFGHFFFITIDSHIKKKTKKRFQIIEMFFGDLA